MRLRALIFEDDRHLRQLLWTVCDDRGYEVFTFPDPGLCPLHIVDQCPCPAGTTCADLIISDVQMPETDGIDFVESIMDKGCRRPHFALMSGGWSDAGIDRARRLGCALFTKPFQLSELVAWLERVESEVGPARRLFDWHGLSQIGGPAG